MDIGTAKPTIEERGTVPYHGIDLVSANETFNSWQYREHALEVLAAVQERGSRAIVVGGTGLYLKLLTHGFADAPGSNPEVRERWERVREAEGVAPLATALREQSPSLYAAIDDRSTPSRTAAMRATGKAGTF